MRRYIVGSMDGSFVSWETDAGSCLNFWISSSSFRLFRKVRSSSRCWSLLTVTTLQHTVAGPGLLGAWAGSCNKHLRQLFMWFNALAPWSHPPSSFFFFFLKSHPPSSCVQTLEGRRQPSCPCAIPAIWHVIKACYQVPPRFMRARHIAAASTCFQFTSLDEEDLWLHPPPHRTFFRTAVWLERINFEVVALSPQCVLQAPFLAHVLWKMLPKPTGIFIATSSVFLPRQTQDGESSPRKSMTPCSSEQFGYRYSQGQEFSSGDPTWYL